MASFDVLALIERLRQLTIQQLEPLRAQGLQLPDLPDMITTGERVYETNLRAILRYLKHVNKGCKRQDPDSCSQVLTYRGVIKQLHDVDEWATKTLLSLDMPEGLNGYATDAFTPDELQEFLNASTASPSTYGDHVPSVADGQEVLSSASDIRATTEPIVVKEVPPVEEGSRVNLEKPERSITTTFNAAVEDGFAFEFDGRCREDTPETSPKLHHFRFRCVSDPTSDRFKNSTMPQYSIEPMHCVGYHAESKPASRCVSAPISTQDASQHCFLQLSGETLEQFIAGVEVEESMVANKRRWLLLLHSLESSHLLGRWPSPAKLRQFMHKHGLDWPVRISGKWDLSPKSFGEREALKHEALGILFAKDKVCHGDSSVQKEAKEIEDYHSTNATVAQAIVSEENLPANPAAEPEAGEEVFKASGASAQPIEGLLDTEISSHDDVNVNHGATSIQQIVDLSARLPSEIVLADEADTIQQLTMPEEAKKPEEIRTQEETNMAEELEFRGAYENLSHIFVWILSGEYARDFEPQEQVNIAEEHEGYSAHDNLSHVFVWLKSGKSALDSDAQAELVLENPEPKDLDIAAIAEVGEDENGRHAQIEEVASKEIALSILGSACLWADVGDFDLTVQGRGSNTVTNKPAEDEHLHVAEVHFATACDESHTPYDVDCDKTQAEYTPAIQLAIDDTREGELPDEFEYDAAGEDKVNNNQTVVVDNLDVNSSSFNAIGDGNNVGEIEISGKAIVASEDLKICNIGSTFEVQEEPLLKIPAIVLTLPDGTEVDIDTIPWKRRKRGEQIVNDPSKLAPPPRLKKVSKQDRSPGSQCDRLCCKRCSKLSPMELEVNAKAQDGPNKTEKSAEKTEKVVKSKTLSNAGKHLAEESLKQFEGKPETKVETQLNTTSEKEPQDNLLVEEESGKVSTTKPDEEVHNKFVCNQKDCTKSPAEVTEEYVATSATPVLAYVDEPSIPLVALDLTNSLAPTTDTILGPYTPPKWSVAPILAGLAVSALYVSARCPFLPALAIVVGSISLKNKLSW